MAAYRARASAIPGGVCRDPWASALAGPDGVEIAAKLDPFQPHMQLWIAVRTAFFDEAVRRLAPPATQVVMLGAGLDTRAARLAHAGVRFFEVDTADSQRDKLERLAKLDGYPLDAATYVTCDFERDDFVDRLTAKGFRVDQPAVFVWEGVTYYLTEPAVTATLSRLASACHPRSRVLFDYVGKKLVERRADIADQRAMGFVEQLGEPFVWGVNDIVPLVYSAGFRWVDVTSFDQACLNLTGTYERDRKFRFQGLVETSVERAEER